MAAVAHKILLFLKIFCGFFHSIVEFFSTKRKSVADKVVVITGAARGIGKEMALLFAALNAKVVVLDIDEVENRKTADAITKAGGRAYAQECDVANPEVMKKVAQSLLHHPEIGIPDILICNAGVLIPNLFCEQSDVDIKKTMDINLLGFFWTLRAFLPHMIRNGSGHIVAMASTASFYGLPSSTSYTASKFGVRGLMSALEAELYEVNGYENFKVTTVYPFFVQTGLLHLCNVKSDLMRILSPSQVAQAIVDAVLLQKSEVYIPKFFFWMLMCDWLLSCSVYAKAAVRQLFNIKYK